ncbi:hypothetical protein ACQ4PT_011157 [Festuca glaucescens]
MSLPAMTAQKVASPKAGDKKVVLVMVANEVVQVQEMHVLPVDDDRAVIAMILCISKYRDTVVSATRALELLGLGLITNVNMIITDYWMPCMTGYELLKRDKVYEVYEVWTPEKGARVIGGGDNYLIRCGAIGSRCRVAVRVTKHRLRDGRLLGVDFLILGLSGIGLGTIVKLSNPTFGMPGYIIAVLFYTDTSGSDLGIHSKDYPYIHEDVELSKVSSNLANNSLRVVVLSVNLIIMHCSKYPVRTTTNYEVRI